MRPEEEIREELEVKKKVRTQAALANNTEIWEYIDTEIKVLEWVLGERSIC